MITFAGQLMNIRLTAEYSGVSASLVGANMWLQSPHLPMTAIDL